MKFHKCASCKKGEECVCEETCSLDERCNCDIFGNLPEIDDSPNVMDRAKHPVKERVTFHLPWYKTQYWSGFILGLEVGLLNGLTFAFVVYKIAKLVVHFIEGA